MFNVSDSVYVPHFGVGEVKAIEQSADGVDYYAVVFTSGRSAKFPASKLTHATDAQINGKTKKAKAQVVKTSKGARLVGGIKDIAKPQKGYLSIRAAADKLGIKVQKLTYAVKADPKTWQPRKFGWFTYLPEKVVNQQAK